MTTALKTLLHKATTEKEKRTRAAPEEDQE